MTRRIVDLSVPLQNAPMENNPAAIQYVNHTELGRMRAKSYGVSRHQLFSGPHALRN